jgi:hypothetical protein
MSTPPSPPTGDAPLPPGSDPALPSPQFQTQGTKPPKKGMGAKIGIAAGVLVLVGGLIFAGIQYGPGLFGKFFGGVPSTPDGTIKYVINGIADNEPEVLWKVLPASHQKTLNEEFKKTLGNVVDSEVHEAVFGVLKKAVGLLKSKKEIILSAVPSVGPGGPDGPGGPPGMGGPPNELQEVLENYDGIVEVLEIVVNGKLSDPAWIKNPDLGELLKADGGKLMSSPIFDKLLDMALASQRELGPKSAAELRSALKNVKVMVVSQTETTSTLKLVSEDLMPNDTESPEFKMVKVGDRWLPEAVAENLEQMISQLKEVTSVGFLTDQGLNKRQKTAVLRFLKALDGVLDAMDKAKNADELMAAAMAGGTGLTIAAQSLQSAFPNFGDSGGFPGGNPAGFPGGIPGVGPQPGLPVTGIGTNNPPALPGLAPQPKVPVGRTERWTINAGSKRRIDIIYMGKPADNVKVAFGEPDAMEGIYWVYNGVKVINIAGGGMFTTVLFGIQDGKVVDVKAR